MYRHSLQCVILLSVVWLWTAESTNLFASSLFKTPEFCSAEVEQEFDLDDLETKGLPVSLAGCAKVSVLVTGPADRYVLVSERLSVSRWHLRGPPTV